MVRTMTNYPIAEVFRSIQGEGFHAGKPVVFIRFSGCNLIPPCTWCDTDHSLKETLNANQIYDRVDGLLQKGDMVVLTGGEPFLHDLEDVLDRLTCGDGARWVDVRVAVETNGTLYETQTAKTKALIDWMTVSPKQGYLLVAKEAIRNASEIKVVYGDYDPAKLEPFIAPRLFEESLCYIQPCSEDFQPALEYVMRHPEWKLSIQLQKVLNIR